MLKTAIYTSLAFGCVAPQEEYEVELEAVEEVFLQEREVLLTANKVLA